MKPITSYVVEQGRMEVYGKLSQDGYNSILSLLSFLWTCGSVSLSSSINELATYDLVEQVNIDQECVK